MAKKKAKPLKAVTPKVAPAKKKASPKKKVAAKKAAPKKLVVRKSSVSNLHRIAAPRARIMEYLAECSVCHFTFPELGWSTDYAAVQAARGRHREETGHQVRVKQHNGLQ